MKKKQRDISFELEPTVEDDDQVTDERSKMPRGRPLKEAEQLTATTNREEKLTVANASRKSGSRRRRRKEKEKDKQEKTVSLEDSDFDVFEKVLKSLDCYHGYLPREDVATLLKDVGDYLLRTAIPSSGSYRAGRRTAKKQNTRSMMAPPSSVPLAREVFVSVLISKSPGQQQPKSGISPSSEKAAKSLTRHVPIRRSDGTYFIDAKKPFKTIDELFEFYKTTPFQQKTSSFVLKSPVKLAVWEYLHEQVNVHNGKLLGEGAFGEVRLGTLKRKSEIRAENGQTVNVAIKMLKTDGDSSKAAVKELMHEARVMRSFSHRNVLKTFGVAVQHEPFYLITEVCSGGSLRDHLRNRPDKVSDADRVGWCAGAARGVEYLHAHRCIHRDLATRNVLLSDDKTAKVADFGLARIADKYQLKYVTKIPVKYLSPETLCTFSYTSKTDVFTFGIVIWEVYADGAEPHAGLSGPEVIAMSKRGQFLKLDERAPESLRKFVDENVFVLSPEKRCTITEVARHLEGLATLRSSSLTPRQDRNRMSTSAAHR